MFTIIILLRSLRQKITNLIQSDLDLLENHNCKIVYIVEKQWTYKNFYYYSWKKKKDKKKLKHYDLIDIWIVKKIKY